MALQVYLGDSSVGSAFQESYARVSLVRVTKEICLISVNWYANQGARLADKLPVYQQEFSVPTTAISGDFLPSIYGYLKTLPEFSGAIDVLNDSFVAPMIDITSG